MFIHRSIYTCLDDVLLWGWSLSYTGQPTQVCRAAFLALFRLRRAEYKMFFDCKMGNINLGTSFLFVDVESWNPHLPK